MPQKYPGKKYYKETKVGQYSCNPLGKNPGDVWVIPNVKHNHAEKTAHPCQFPVELIERLVLALTKENDLVVDPYLGVGSAAGADVVREYLNIAANRARLAWEGKLPRRPLNRPVYVPKSTDRIAQVPPDLIRSRQSALQLQLEAD